MLFIVPSAWSVRIEEQKDGWVNEYEWMNECTDDWMNECKDDWKDERMNELMNERKDEWVNE